jgi:hypothetical protein
MLTIIKKADSLKLNPATDANLTDILLIHAQIWFNQVCSFGEKLFINIPIESFVKPMPVEDTILDFWYTKIYKGTSNNYSC